MLPDKLITVSIAAVFHSSFAIANVSFSPPVEIDTPGATADIIALDLDDDGDLDIASLEIDFNFGVGEAVGLLNVALNDGEGNFSTPTTFNIGTFFSLEFALQRLVAADIDNDGDPDLAAIGTTAPLLLMLNDGTGGFDEVVTTDIVVSGGPLNTMLDAGDINGDGNIDLAMGLPGQIAINDGAGALTAAGFSGDSNPQNIEIVDLDNDGDKDIAFGFRVHLNDGAGSFSLDADTTYPGSFARECVFEDFDGDGDADVACARNFAGEISIAHNNGDAAFGPTTTFVTTELPIDIHAGHFNDDAFLDLLVTHSVGSEIIGVYLGRGDGTFDDALILPSTDGTLAATGDLNGDGFDDVVMSTGFVFSTSDEPIAVLLNQGTTLDHPADFDGDGSVGFTDLLQLLAAWGSCNTCAEDLDQSGDVGFSDLLQLLAAWG